MQLGISQVRLHMSLALWSLQPLIGRLKRPENRIWWGAALRIVVLSTALNSSAETRPKDIILWTSSIRGSATA